MPKHLKEKRSIFSKFIVLLIVASNIAFTAAVLYVFYRIQAEPTTLIVSWFAFTTGELGALAGIKAKKLKNTADKSSGRDAN